tara:strand:- start:2949 stop:3122 length:174 start_codon:yes stop_codon:yes gene_type:complete
MSSEYVQLDEVVLNAMKGINPDLPPKTVKQMIKMWLPSSHHNKDYIDMIFEKYQQRS